ncbi:hypothetical protein IXO812_10420 [Xanthomonas oryzae pv. oryzae]|nr:hypothetical protein IXO812_10420 [Xanthomonas oryzae pv. oryzae]
MSVQGFALGGDAAVGDVQRGKKGGCAMAHGVVRDAFDVPQPRRQHRLGTLQGLYLALLVHTQHQRMIGRVQIQADDVAHLSR